MIKSRSEDQIELGESERRKEKGGSRSSPMSETKVATIVCGREAWSQKNPDGC